MPNYESFTEANVKKLRSRVTSGRVEYQAKDLPALHLRISPTSASWYVRKRVPGGSWVRVLLGKVDDMSVEAARKLALKAVGKLVDGQDLAAEKRARKAEEERNGLTLGEGLAIYLAEREQLRPATKATYERDLRTTFGDYWDKPLVELTPERVKDRHRDRKTRAMRAQARVKTAAARKRIKASPARADGAVRALRAMVNYLRDERGLDLPDVARRIRATKGWGNVSPRQRAFIGDALPEFVAAVQGQRDDLLPDLSGTQRDLTLLLLCTALRWSSGAGLLWSEVDFKANIITVPEDRMKGKKAHPLPLGPVMMTMLRERQKSARSDVYVFPGLGRKTGGRTVHKAIGGLTKAFKGKIKDPEGNRISWSPHDLRRTALTKLESMDISTISVKKIAAHSQGDITAKYIFQDVDRLRAPMERLEREFLEPRKSGKVVPLRRAKG